MRVPHSSPLLGRVGIFLRISITKLQITNYKSVILAIPRPTSPMSEPTTPLMRQHAAIKKEHPTALLFFRVGDFYELFFEDAVVASRELQITLTSRSKDAG